LIKPRMTHPKYRILIAPACLKGSLSALGTAAFIAEFLKARLHDSVILDICPIADGGDDTLAVLQAADSGFMQKAKRITGPLPEMQVEARYLLHSEKKTAILEAAQAHGYQQLAAHGLSPMDATSYGVGELLLAIISETPALEKIIVTLGGSASTDGGFGALQALGVRFYDSDGKKLDIPIGGGDLSRVYRIEWLPEWPYKGQILLATDTINPLLGEMGTARVFAPQKGASSEQCQILERGLTSASQILAQTCGMDYTDLPGSGAAGGLAYGLRHLPGCGIASGSQWIAEALGLTARIKAASLVITGEGRFDFTSLQGKATGHLLFEASEKPVFFFCGQIQENLPVMNSVQIFPFLPQNASPEVQKASILNPTEALQKQLETAWPQIEAMLG
jgi:glycerate kinase